MDESHDVEQKKSEDFKNQTKINYGALGGMFSK